MKALSGGSVALKALRPISRAISSTPCSRDASSEAESSTSRWTPSTVPSTAARPAESAQEAFKRNLEQVQATRRKRDAQRATMPLILPQGATPPKSSPLQMTLSTLLASGAALGHSTSLLHPAYTPYIYGNRSGLSIIDLDQTLPILRRVSSLVREVVSQDGIVLLVGTRPGLRKMLEKAKLRLGDNGYAVNKWMPGTLTNAQTFFGIQPIEDGSYLPDLVIFLNPSENIGAIRECTSRNIPTVGIVDTDTDPRIVTYAIPANMESHRTSELILGTLSIAGQEGRRLRRK